MKWLNIISPLFLLFALSCSVPKFEADPASRNRAVLRGEIREALVFYESQAHEAEKSAAASLFAQQYWEAAAQNYMLAASAARTSGQLQKSISYSEKALEMSEKTKDPNLQLRAITQMVRAYESVRNFDRARELVEKGLGIVKEIAPNTGTRMAREGAFYAELGRDLMRRQQYKKAIEALSQSLSLRKDMLDFLSRSRAPNRETNIEIFRVHVINNLKDLGDAYRQAGKLQEALEQYQGAFSAINQWSFKTPFEGDLYNSVGEIYFRDTNFAQALENFKRALTFAERQQRPDAISSASVRIGDVLRQTGKAEEATPHYQKAIHQIESTRSLLQSEQFRQSYFEEGLNAYVSMIGVLLESGKPDEAFSYSERARSRAFLDLLGSKAQLSRVKSGLLEEERALRERIASIKARLSNDEDGQTDGTGLTKELSEAEQAYGAFLSKVRKQDKEQASLMSVEPLTLLQVQELLDPGTTLIEYFVTGPVTYTWIVEKDKLQFVKVDLPREKLSSLVKTLRESIFTLGEKEKFNEVSAALYKQLIESLLPRVIGKELIIVPHDVLHYLPFHALLSPEGKYLIESYPIYYLSSASLLQFTKEKRKAKGERVLAMGNPDLGDLKMNLQFAELEAKKIQELYPNSTVLLKKEATEEKGKALSPQNDIIHFATHAELSEEDPLSSAILLAKEGKEDGRLEVREIFGMDLHANLVVLSACETGLGKLSSGDELVGLTRAFIYAGTPSVMASLWNVEDSSTAQLMASFYKNLKTMSKVEALRQAQLELIRGQANSDLLVRRGVGGIGKLGEVPEARPTSTENLTISTSHPYFWAPFILVGDGK